MKKSFLSLLLIAVFISSTTLYVIHATPIKLVEYNEKGEEIKVTEAPPCPDSIYPNELPKYDTVKNNVTDYTIGYNSKLRIDYDNLENKEEISISFKIPVEENMKISFIDNGKEIELFRGKAVGNNEENIFSYKIGKESNGYFEILNMCAGRIEFTEIIVS